MITHLRKTYAEIRKTKEDRTVKMACGEAIAYDRASSIKRRLGRVVAGTTIGL